VESLLLSDACTVDRRFDGCDMVADSTCSLPHSALPAQPQFPFADSKPTDPSWGIEVNDNGQGMSSADLPRMLRLYADQSYAGAAKKVRAVTVAHWSLLPSAWCCCRGSCGVTIVPAGSATRSIARNMTAHSIARSSACNTRNTARTRPTF
jgi:hypothetical protein